MKKNIILILVLMLALNSCAQKDAVSYCSISRIEKDLTSITKTKKSRNYINTETLDQVADYIFEELAKSCDTVYFQTFMVNGKEYKNVIGSIGIEHDARIVIGAHYDVAGEQEGADDNASGVCGVLELARLLSNEKINNRIDFVAYTLEEPPFYGTKYMGSYIHAKSLYDEKVNLRGMICLEMIGYFDTTRRSQRYPIGLLKLFYGGKGDFITVVQKNRNGKFGKDVNRLMKQQGLIETKSFKASPKLPGIDFSDHRNYWIFDFSAVMITNTAFYRNPNYHEVSDKMETLDLKKMSLVINELYLTVKNLQ